MSKCQSTVKSAVHHSAKGDHSGKSSLPVAYVGCSLQEGVGEAEQICTNQWQLSVFRSNLCASCVTILPPHSLIDVCGDTTLCVSATSVPAAGNAIATIIAAMIATTTAMLAKTTTTTTTTAAMMATTTAVKEPTTAMRMMMCLASVEPG